MLQKLEIKNFQSHKDTIIEFDKGLNTIVGMSDSGKSGILKALNWVIHSKPEGDAFRSHWGGDTEVTLHVDGHIITRRKTKKLNEYELDGSVYKALGGKVPPEIQSILMMNELNTQYQFDSHFLLTDTPGEVSKKLNKTVNLDIIDTTIKKVQSKISATNSEIKSENNRLNDFNKDLLKYDKLDVLSNKIKQAEQFVISHKDKKLITEVLSAAIEKYNENNVVFESADNYIKKYEKLKETVEQAITIGNNIEQFEEGLVCIQNLLKNTSENEDIIKYCDEVLDSFKKCEELIIEAKRVDKDMTTKEGLSEALSNIVDSHNKLEETIKQYTTEEEKLQAEFDDLMPERCPLCGK